MTWFPVGSMFAGVGREPQHLIHASLDTTISQTKTSFNTDHISMTDFTPNPGSPFFLVLLTLFLNDGEQ